MCDVLDDLRAVDERFPDLVPKDAKLSDDEENPCPMGNSKFGLRCPGQQQVFQSFATAWLADKHSCLQYNQSEMNTLMPLLLRSANYTSM